MTSATVFAFAAASVSFLGTASHAQKPAAQKPAAAPIFCVITGESIASTKDAAGKATVGGKTYYFCCPGCVSKFAKTSDQQKAKFAKNNDLRVKQVVLQKQLDAVKAELKQAEKATPTAPEPMHHAATPAATKSGLTCAVTGEAIASPADAAGGKSDYNNKTYYFCCPGCKTKFDAAPAKYAALADVRKSDVPIK